MRAPYKPQTGSTVARVLAFFEQNPGEELTRSDVAVKFGLGITSVSGTLAAAVQAGMLAWQRNSAGRWVYCAPQAEGAKEVGHG